MDQEALKTGFRKGVAYLPLWVRKKITQAKVKELSEHIMPVEELRRCEEDDTYRKSAVKKRMDQYPKQTKIMYERLENLFSTNPLLCSISEEKKKEMVEDIKFCWFGYGIRAHEYVFFDLKGKNRSADRRRRLVGDAERTAFRFCANDFSNTVYADKVTAYENLKKYYKRDMLVIDGEKDRERFHDFVDGKSRFVQKAISSSRGQGVKLIDLSDYPSADSYYDDAVHEGKLLLEEVIIQSQETACFNPDSVNTVRLSTFYTRDGIEAPFGFFRTGRRGSFVDNCATGGVFSAIDTVEGIVSSDSCDEFGNRYEYHPDSEIPLKGFKLPEWDKALELCKSAALLTPDLKYLSWDLAYSDKYGWDIVEVNTSGQFVNQAASLEGMRDILKPIIDNMDLMIPFTIRDL